MNKQTGRMADSTMNVGQPKKKRQPLVTAILSGLFLTAAAGTASAAAYTVCSSGCNYSTIQSGIDDVTVVNGDTLYVLDGTYAERINFSGKNITIDALLGPASTTITGDGTNNPVVTFANSETSSAVLKGFTIDNSAAANSYTRGISITGAAAPTLDGLVVEGNKTTSTWVQGGGIYINGGSAIVQNSTIGGNASNMNTCQNGCGIYATGLTQDLQVTNNTFSYNQGSHGSAIYATANSSGKLLVSGTIFQHHDGTQHGGAIFGSNTDVVVTNSSFTDNNTINSGQYGGAIYVSGTSGTLDVSGTTFDSNNATGRGGAIHIQDSTAATPLKIVNSDILNSSCVNEAGGISTNNLGGTSTLDTVSISGNTSTKGGGVYAINTDMEIINSDITNNSSTYNGGGIVATGAGHTVTVTGGNVTSNVSGIGGGIYVNAASLAVDGTNISSNSTTGSYGGGIYATGAPAVNVDNAVIAGNQTVQRGGGVYLASSTANIVNTLVSGNASGTSTWETGGGINVGSYSTLNLYSSTVAGNYSPQGGGIANFATANLKNSIVWGNAGIKPDVNGTFTAIYSNIKGGYTGSGLTFDGDLDGTGNYGTDTVNDDPQFTQISAASSGNPTTGGDYHIATTSPMVNVGKSTGANVPTIDMDNETRDATIDIGVDEQLSAPPPPSESISGMVYSDQGVTPIADGTTIHLVVNGTSAGTTTTTSGAYSISVTDFTAGDALLVYIDGAASAGNTVTVSDGTDLAGVDIYADHLIPRHDNGGNASNDILKTALGSHSDTDVIYSVDASNVLTITGSNELYIPTGETFIPGGTVNAVDVEVDGSFWPVADTINVSGNWDAVTGSVITVGTISFTASSGTVTINAGGTDTNHDFATLEITGTATFSLSGAIDVDNNLTMNWGYLVTNDNAITVGGNYSQTAGAVAAGSSTITVAGDVTMDGTVDSTGYNNTTLVMTGAGSNLTYNNLSAYWANGVNDLVVGQSGVVDTLNSNMAVRGVMTVGSGEITGSKSFFIRGAGTPLSFDPASKVSVAYLKFNGATQNLPTLANGYDTHLFLVRNNMVITQTGDITINGTHNLYVTGNNNVANTVTYNTAGYDLTVGNKIEIGVSGDTGVKTLNGVGSIIDVGTAININSGLAVFNYTPGNVTVAGNPYP